VAQTDGEASARLLGRPRPHPIGITRACPRTRRCVTWERGTGGAEPTSRACTPKGSARLATWCGVTRRPPR